MGQQSEAQKSSPQETQDISEEGSFLSPEETSTILSSLEAIDQKMLSEPSQAYVGEDEGFFISPEEIEGGSTEGEAGEETSSAHPLGESREEKPSRAGNSTQSDLLSRIAGELKSIKTEIGSLKETYDGMIAKASSIAGSEARSEIRMPLTQAPEQSPSTSTVPVSVPAVAGQVLPEEIFADLKKLLSYLDRLLESLPEDKIDGFARSEYFELYRKIFEFFDLV